MQRAGLHGEIRQTLNPTKHYENKIQPAVLPPAAYPRRPSAVAAGVRDGSGDPLKKECLLPALVDTLMHTQGLQVEVLSTKAVWFGVTYKEDKDYVAAELKKLHDNGSYPPAL